MTKIEKIENIMEDDKIKNVIMSISNGEEVIDAEVYLAFVDTITNKRYVVYTSEKAQNEDDRVPFTLSTLRLEENGYVLEETSKEDHQNIELPILNIIGLNSDKEPEQVLKMITDKFPGIGILSLQALKQNVDNITISEKKPPKKANMPIAIANVIKKFYLHQLNKELKKVYSVTEMSIEDKDASVEKFNEIEGKLDFIKEVYENNAEKRGGPTSKIENSLEQIEMAKKDIEAAKNRIENLSYEYTKQAEEPKQPIESLEEEIEQQENIEQPLKESEEISIEESYLKQPEDKISFEEPIKKLEETTIESPIADKISQEGQISVEAQIEDVVKIAVDKFQVGFEDLINDISQGIVDIYEKKLNGAEAINASLRQKIYEQEQIEQKQLQEMLEQINVLSQKAQEAEKQANHYKEINEKLSNELSTSKENEQLLKKENDTLNETVTSQKEQMNQQNALIDSIREESKNRDEQQQSEIVTLKKENARLKIYEEEYNKVAVMFTSKLIDPEQKEIEDAVEKVLNQR